MSEKKFRPKSVKLFEIIFLVFLGIGVLSGSTIWIFGALDASANDQIQIALVQGGIFFSILFLVLLVSRKKSNIARWLLLAACLLFAVIDIPTAGIINTNIPIFIHSYILDSNVLSLFGLIQSIQVVLQFVALYLIFRADTVPWFRGDS